MPLQFGGSNFAVLNLQSLEIPKHPFVANGQRIGLRVNPNEDIQKCTNLGFDAITKLQQFAQPKPRKPFRTMSVDCGTPLIANIDDVAEVLAVVEGEAFR